MEGIDARLGDCIELYCGNDSVVGYLVRIHESEGKICLSQEHPYKHKSDFIHNSLFQGRWYSLGDYEGFKVLKPVEMRRSPELIADLVLQLARSKSYKRDELEEALTKQYGIEEDFAHDIIWRLFSLGKINADHHWRLITSPQVAGKS